MLIVERLKGVVLTMAKAIFKVLLKLIKGVVNIILAPINLLVVNMFPDLSSLLSSFNTIVSNVIGSGLSWFAHLLPPNTKTFILLYLSILIIYYTMYSYSNSIIDNQNRKIK